MAGIYIHIPYCHAKCAYCDFFSTPRAETASDYIRSVTTELRLRYQELEGEPVSTIYIGGGTPTSLDLAQLTILLEAISSTVDMSAVEEFTVEANPEDINATLLNLLAERGVNRISMGVQSLNDDELISVGRLHTASRALEAIESVASRFNNYSLDIIFGLPGQTLKTLSTTLDSILSFLPPHLSTYLLSYEPGTRLYARLLAGKVKETSEEIACEMYALICRRLSEAGYIHYEISNHALPGFHSRHNSAYWDSTPYLGLGVSAHSFIRGHRVYNPNDIKSYVNAINDGSSCYIIDEETEANRFNDCIITSLRTARGFDLNQLTSWSPSIRKVFMRQLADLEKKSLEEPCIERVGDKLFIPSSHWLTADAVLRQLIIV